MTLNRELPPIEQAAEALNSRHRYIDMHARRQEAILAGRSLLNVEQMARVLANHPGWRFRAEEPGDWYVCSGCGTELETLRSAFPQEFYDHQAEMLRAAQLGEHA